MNIKSLINTLCSERTETEWIEFKANYFDPQLIGEYISALSNSACLCEKDYGYLVFGVENKTHKIIGTNFFPKTAKGKGNEGLEPWLTRLLFPRIDISIIEYNYENKHIVIFRIDPTQNTPVKFKGIAYIRVGEHKHKMSEHPEKERKIWNKKEKYDWSKQIIKDASVNDLDETAISMARKHFIEKNPKLTEEVAEWNTIDFLNKAKITIRGEITNTAIILLGKPESEHFLDRGKAQITWILKDTNGIKIDYELFFPPFLINVEEAVKKIRNLKLRYIITNTLFPTEILTYEPWVIREALHNCIAHQDYELSGRIIIMEESDQLIFSNLGSFLPENIKNVILQEFSLEKLRNPFLANAMVNLNMIDTIGSGIYRMFKLQKERFFPLPDYEIFSEKIKVTIPGKIIDENYTKLLIQKTDLDIWKVFLLDQIQKKKQISKSNHKILKKEKLVEGRYPNLFISKKIAEATEQKAEYIKAKAFNDKYYQDLIIEFLNKHKEADRKDFEELLFSKLSDILTEKQKKTKLKNLKTKMKNLGIIDNMGSKKKPVWVLYNKKEIKRNKKK
ncbi:MAG: putative DNA binding domain-containing protein [Candidatus Cloacimonadota bacterium]|nr:putative DNA binding domain-containing protein [Candidatus Cloacimonadota bacterium]